MESKKVVSPVTAKPALTPRGASAAVVEQLRSRHVQAEMRLRELEDRFRRDCLHQEHEIDMLKLENNKLKAKIEEYRMADSAPKPAGGDNAMESPQIKCLTQKYRNARNTVEQARGELQDIQTKLAETRQQVQEFRREKGTINTRERAARAQLLKDSSLKMKRGEESRTRLRALEFHVETESDRAAELMESAKTLRREIDVQLNIQNRGDDAYTDRERALTELNNETSFLSEVCTVLFQERDEAREALKRMQQKAEEEGVAYDNIFREFMGVEARDKENKTMLRDSIKKLQQELLESKVDRDRAEKRVEKEKHATDSRGGSWTSNKTPRGGAAAVASEEEDDGIGLQRQLAEFEKYFSRFSTLAGSDNMLDVKAFVCNSSDERFQLYSALHYAQESVRELERERSALFANSGTAVDATDDERQARLELNASEEELQRLQREITDEKERMEVAMARLDAALPVIHKLFKALDCDDSAITAVHGVNTISYQSVCEFLSALEHRLEEYTVLWLHMRKSGTSQSTRASPKIASVMFKEL